MTKKYAPLRSYLENVPASRAEVGLHFEDIETILKDRLPKSASQYRQWWANQSSGSRAPSWLSAGFLIDGVDLDLKSVTFRRDPTAAREIMKPAMTRKKNHFKRAAGKPVNERMLLDAGFKQFGSWELRDGNIYLAGDIPIEPAVYAHVTDGQIFYIGSATRGLKKRLYFYQRPGVTQQTSIRINALIKEELAAGRRVWVIAAFPDPTGWNGLPVDTVTGLEAGLLSRHSPYTIQIRGNRTTFPPPRELYPLCSHPMA